MQRLIFTITLPWVDDVAGKRLAEKIAPHLDDRDYMLHLLSKCPEININMSEHVKVEKEPVDEVSE